MEDDAARCFEPAIAVNERIFATIRDIHIAKMLDNPEQFTAVDSAHDADEECDFHDCSPFQGFNVRADSYAVILSVRGLALYKVWELDIQKPQIVWFFCKI